MKKIIIFLVFVFLFLFSSNVIAKQWYEGGTLHLATVAIWKNASYSNKIATAADWVASSQKGKSVFRETRDINALMPYVLNLVRCVDEATAGPGSGDMRISGIAGSCIILLGYN